MNNSRIKWALMPLFCLLFSIQMQAQNKWPYIYVQASINPDSVFTKGSDSLSSLSKRFVKNGCAESFASAAKNGELQVYAYNDYRCITQNNAGAGASWKNINCKILGNPQNVALPLTVTFDINFKMDLQTANCFNSIAEGIFNYTIYVDTTERRGFLDIQINGGKISVFNSKGIENTEGSVKTTPKISTNSTNIAITDSNMVALLSAYTNLPDSIKNRSIYYLSPNYIRILQNKTATFGQWKPNFDTMAVYNPNLKNVIVKTGFNTKFGVPTNSDFLVGNDFIGAVNLSKTFKFTTKSSFVIWPYIQASTIIVSACGVGKNEKATVEGRIPPFIKSITLPAGFANSGIDFSNLRVQVDSNTFIPIVREGTTALKDIKTDLNCMISPNPFNENLTIALTTDVNQKVKIKVFDMLGNLVLQEFRIIENGGNQLLLTTSMLKQGAFILVLETEEGLISRKIIKL